MRPLNVLTLARRTGWAAGLLGAVLCTSGGTIFAADANVGTGAAQFLKLGGGARPAAMGDAYVAVSDDVNAVQYNPAGLGRIEQAEMTAMHAQWFQDMNYEFGAVAVPTSLGTFAFSAATLKASDLEERNADESYIGTFDTVDAAYGLSYGKKISDRLALGGTARMIRQKIGSTSAGALSGDVGILSDFADGRVSAGFAVRHMGQDVKFEREGDPLPLTVDGGAALHLVDRRLTMAFDLRKSRDNGVQAGAGAEWKQALGDSMRAAFRAGYTTAGTDADGTTGIALGAGLGFKRINMDAAWIPFGDLGQTFRYAATFRF
jgi:hypothetical protein